MAPTYAAPGLLNAYIDLGLEDITYRRITASKEIELLEKKQC